MISEKEIVITLPRKRLLEGLACVKVSIPTLGASIQQYKCLRFRTAKRKLYFQTMSSSSSCTYMFKKEIDELVPDGIDGAVEYEKIFHVVSKSKRDNIKIKWQPKLQRFRLIAEGTSTLNTLPIESWITTSNEKTVDVDAELSAEELSGAWRATCFTITPEVTRYDLRGVYYDGNYVTSTGTYISIYKTKKESQGLLISPELGKFVELINSSKIELESLAMKRHEDRRLILIMHTKHGALRSSLALQNANFPDWKRARDLTEEKCIHSFKMPKEAFLEALERIEVFVDRSRSVLFTLFSEDKARIRVSIQNEESVEYTEEILEIKEHNTTIDQDMQIRLNYDVFTNIFNESIEENIEINYLNSHVPLLLNIGDKVQYVISTMVKVR